MTSIKTIAQAALCGWLLCGCASTESPEPPRYGYHGGHHPRNPKQGRAPDPVISADVFLFLPYDSDHDHHITKSELAAAIAGNWRDVAGSRAQVRLLELQDWFTRLDGTAATPFNPLEFAADGGDSVSREQFAAVLTRRFRGLDRNGDGILEPSEFMTIPGMRPRPAPVTSE